MIARPRTRLDATRRASAPRAGATVVEAAVVLPIVLMIILGIFEFARLIMTINVCDNAVRWGARYAVVHSDSALTTDITAAIESRIPPAARPFQGYVRDTNIKIFKADSTGARVGAVNDPDTWKNAAFNEYIAVTITGQYKPIMPVGWVGFSALNIKCAALMYSEAN